MEGAAGVTYLEFLLAFVAVSIGVPAIVLSRTTEQTDLARAVSLAMAMPVVPPQARAADRGTRFATRHRFGRVSARQERLPILQQPASQAAWRLRLVATIGPTAWCSFCPGQHRSCPAQ